MSTNWQQSTVQGSRSAAARTAAATESDDVRRGSAPGRGQSEPRRSERGTPSQSSGKKPRRRRKRSVWLKLFQFTIVPILLLCSIVAGLYVGYSVLGKQAGGEAFQMETWKHLYDLMFSKS